MEHSLPCESATWEFWYASQGNTHFNHYGKTDFWEALRQQAEWHKRMLTQGWKIINMAAAVASSNAVLDLQLQQEVRKLPPWDKHDSVSGVSETVQCTWLGWCNDSHLVHFDGGMESPDLVACAYQNLIQNNHPDVHSWHSIRKCQDKEASHSKRLSSQRRKISAVQKTHNEAKKVCTVLALHYISRLQKPSNLHHKI